MQVLYSIYYILNGLIGISQCKLHSMWALYFLNFTQNSLLQSSLTSLDCVTSSSATPPPRSLAQSWIPCNWHKSNRLTCKTNTLWPTKAGWISSSSIRAASITSSPPVKSPSASLTLLLGCLSIGWSMCCVCVTLHICTS
ncbi:hypothetical protein J3E69DRAFT_344706 [Trichoderma sp. SZMC 28015]